MTRRNFIAVVSLCVLVALGAIVVGVGLFATQSARGQDSLRSWVQARIASSINGKVHVGRISGNFLTGVTIDSLELRDDEDSLFFAAGRIGLSYDPRDLVDRRLYFRRIDLEHPAIVLRQHENWKWNYKKLFRMGGPSKPRGPERGFGDFVILDSVHVRGGGSFRVTIPWHTDDSLRGAKRDSAIRVNIARKDASSSNVIGRTDTIVMRPTSLNIPHSRWSVAHDPYLLYHKVRGASRPSPLLSRLVANPKRSPTNVPTSP